MAPWNQVSRRDFLNQALAVAGAAGAASGLAGAAPTLEPPPEQKPGPVDSAGPHVRGTMPSGTLGGAKVGRLLLGGNLIGGYMHCRDLKYVNSLFRA
jgi:hypothetical protein